jgi:hypothetical protein
MRTPDLLHVIYRPGASPGRPAGLPLPTCSVTCAMPTASEQRADALIASLPPRAVEVRSTARCESSGVHHPLLAIAVVPVPGKLLELSRLDVPAPCDDHEVISGLSTVH